MTDDHEIRVTLRDVYEVQQAQSKAMSDLSAKLDVYIGSNNWKEDIVKDHERRLRVVERYVFAIPGVSLVIALAGLLVAILRGH